MFGRPAPRLGASLVLAAAAAIVLCALVVMGAAANPLRAPIHDGLSTSDALGDVVFVFAVVAAVVGVVVVVVATMSFRPAGTPVMPRRRRSFVPVLLALLVALTLRSFMHRTTVEPRAPVSPTFPAAAAAEPAPSSHVWRDTGWVLVAVLGAGALGAALVLLRHGDRSFAVEATDVEAATIPTAVAGAVDAALAELEAAGDPRLTIIAAYARMLEALEQHGLACRPSETPRVHLARCLAAADVRAQPLEQLVELFEEARFSTHPMTWAHRDEARRALVAVRHDLVVGAG